MCDANRPTKPHLAATPVPDATAVSASGLPAPAIDDVGSPPQLVNHPRYRVVRLLGRGGMGAVYLVEHRRMERLVALKVINPSLTDDVRAVQRFHLEVKAASQLVHPNIVTAYDADEAGDSIKVHFLVMEYVEGQSLATYLAQHGPLLRTEACGYARQAALGLQHAHERGMVHRDIKPHNLIRSPSGQIKILDFGLARLAKPQTDPPGESPSLTQQGAIMGTADYIAPEQASNSHTVDIRADLYSLGCTLYQMLTGKVPFPTGSNLEKIIKHTREKPTELSSLRPDLPESLLAVVRKMMAKRPQDRYQTPAEVAEALLPLAQGNPVQGADMEPAFLEHTALATPGAAPIRRSRSRRWLAAALAVAAVGVAVAAVVALTSDPPPVQRTAAPATLTLDTPTAAVKVVIERDGQLVAVLDGAKQTLQALDPGAYTARLDGVPGTLKIEQPVGVFQLAAGETLKIVVRQVPPPAPLSTAKEGPGKNPLVKFPVVDFRFARDVDSKALEAWLGKLGPDFRPSYLSVTSLTAEPHFNVIAVRDGQHHPFKFRQIEPNMGQELVPKEGPPALASHYLLNGKLVSARIIIEDRRKLFYWHSNDLGVITTKINDGRKINMRPICLNAVFVPKGVHYDVVLGLDKQIPWDFRVNLTGPELTALMAEVEKKQWRPDWLCAYADESKRIRFAAILVANREQLLWKFQMSLSTMDLDRNVADMKAMGLRPLAVASYLTKGPGLQHSVVWLQYYPGT